MDTRKRFVADVGFVDAQTAESALDIKAILARYGLVEKDVMRVLGVTAAAIGYWRRGERRPSPKIAIEAEKKLNIPRHELRPDLWPPPAGGKRKSRSR